MSFHWMHAFEDTFFTWCHDKRATLEYINSKDNIDACYPLTELIWYWKMHQRSATWWNCIHRTIRNLTFQINWKNTISLNSAEIIIVCLCWAFTARQPSGVMLSAVSLPNQEFTGQAWSSKRLTSIVHILSPETDNCPSWISWRERMTVENISWSISTKECCRPRRGLNPRPPGLQPDGASNWATEAGSQIIILWITVCIWINRPVQTV